MSLSLSGNSIEDSAAVSCCTGNTKPVLVHTKAHKHFLGSKWIGGHFFFSFCRPLKTDGGKKNMEGRGGKGPFRCPSLSLQSKSDVLNRKEMKDVKFLTNFSPIFLFYISNKVSRSGN